MQDGINRTYKDSLFCLLFGRQERKENMISLVNAITGQNYPMDTEVTITTIEDAVYMDVKNDVSFLIRDKLHLFEHQSSINPNMAIREFIYTATQIKGMIENENIYGRELITLPTPICYVLCNDPKMKEDKQVLKLSDSFRCKDIECGCEWTTTVININHGHNKGILSVCQALEQYSVFVQKIRDFDKELKNSKLAVDFAVNWCIENGILSDLLLKNKAEVTNMVLTEYNQEQHLAMERKQEYEIGRREGRYEGFTEGKNKGIFISSQIFQKIQSGITDSKILAKELNCSIADVEEIRRMFNI